LNKQKPNTEEKNATPRGKWSTCTTRLENKDHEVPDMVLRLLFKDFSFCFVSL
jgi:hypothetical protein